MSNKDLQVLQKQVAATEALIQTINNVGSKEDDELIANLRTERDIMNAAISEADPNVLNGEKVDTADTDTLRYGYPLNETPIRPPLDNPEFAHWPPDMISTEGEPPFKCMAPNRKEEPPKGFAYPEAQTYIVQKDHRFQRGYVALANFDSSTKKEIMDRQLRLTTAPGTTNPPYRNGSFEPEPIACALQAYPGLPMAHTIDGDPQNIVTFFACHTLKSLEKSLKPEIYTSFESAMVDLACETWGCPETATRRARPPFFTHKGLKRNGRSPQNLPPGSHDGSYNLASTVGKGEGQGCVMPAFQIDTAEGTAQINRILQHLSFLGDIILRATLSRFEYEVTQFHSIDNNVFGFGGLRPYATGCQANVSSSTRNLAEAIGEGQGSWHPDKNDDYTRLTVAILLLRLPPGSDPGAWIAARPAIFVRELDAWAVEIVFSGNDMHSGFTPCFDITAREEWLSSQGLDEPWNRAGPENRCLFVTYYSIAATLRLASMSISRPLHYGNQGATVPHKLHQRTYCEHGDVVLGNCDDRANRLGREMVFQFLNGLQEAKLKLKVSVGTLMKMISYEDEHGQDISLHPPEYDMVTDAQTVKLWRGYYAWYRQQRLVYYIRITKDQFASVQTYLKIKSANTGSFPITERRPIITRVLTKYLGQPEHVVQRVLARQQIDGKISWKVLLEDEDKPQWILEMHAPWFWHPVNRSLFHGFITKEAPTNPIHGQIQQTGTLTTASATPSAIRPTVATQSSSKAANMSQLTLSESDKVPVLSGPLLIVATDSRSMLPPPKAVSVPQSPAPAAVPNLPELQEEGPHTLPPAPPEPDDVPDSLGQTPAIVLSLPDTPARASALAPAEDPPAQSVDLLGQAHTAVSSPPATSVPKKCGKLKTKKTARKRKREADEKDEYVDSDNEDQSQEWEVEQIVGFRKGKDGKEDEWHVRWTGYNDIYMSWEPMKNLENAKEALEAFNKTITDSDSDVRPDLAVAARAKTMQALKALFNYDQLKSEFDGMKDAHRFADLKKGYKPTNTTDLVVQLMDHFESSKTYSVYMDYAPLDAQELPQWNNVTASMAVTQLMNAVDILPVFAQESRKLDMVQRMMRLESCRSLLVIYDWYSDTGDKLASALMKVHLESGYPGLEKAYPRFAKLVHHVVLYMRGVRVNQVNASKVKMARGGKGTAHKSKHSRHHEIHEDAPVDAIPSGDNLPDPAAQAVANIHEHFPIDDISHVPWDMYGLREATRTAKLTLSAPVARNGKGIGPTDDSLYAAAAKCLFALWQKYLIYPGLKEIDTYYNEAKGHLAAKRKFTEEQVILRALGRGGVLERIYDICGDEGIFAANAIAPLLSSPSLIFEENYRGDRGFANALLRDPEKTLQPLTKWLQENVTDEIKEVAARMSPFMLHRLLEMHRGESISESKFLSPGLFVEDDDELPLANIDPQTLSKAKKGEKTGKSAIPVTVNNLVKSGGLCLAKLAIIIRESTNESRHLAPGNEYLYNVLQGRHPTQHRQQYNRDQTDPIRAFNIGTKRLLEKIPGVEITKVTGLSCLLVWMSTGQGTDKTLTFVNQREHFIFSNLDECIRIFDDALASNAAIIAGSQFGGRQIDSIDGYVSLDNPNIYGAAANSLKLLPTRGRKLRKRKYTLVEKFGPFFHGRLMTKWKEFLGDMFGQDPHTFTGQKHTWADGLKMLVDLNLDGFKSGLTLLQTVNNLVYESVLIEPTGNAITTWMADNRDLGAYRGLSELGFMLIHDGFMRVAVRLLHDHMDRYLTTEDKAILDFGYIFVEQILCKVVRWNYRLRQGNVGNLESLAQEVMSVVTEWVAGENATDHSKFPFPLHIDDDTIEATIKASIF